MNSDYRYCTKTLPSFFIPLTWSCRCYFFDVPTHPLLMATDSGHMSSGHSRQALPGSLSWSSHFQAHLLTVTPSKRGFLTFLASHMQFPLLGLTPPTPKSHPSPFGTFWCHLSDPFSLGRHPCPPHCLLELSLCVLPPCLLLSLLHSTTVSRTGRGLGACVCPPLQTLNFCIGGLLV